MKVDAWTLARERVGKFPTVERMEAIRARIREVVARSGLTDREFSRKARLKSETHIGLIKSGETKTIQVKTLDAIAAAGGVTLEYLLTGEDVPHTSAVVDGHPDPEFRRAARAFLELRRHKPDAIDVVAHYSTLPTRSDLDADEWFEEFVLEHRRRGRGLNLQGLAPDPSELVGPPTGPARPKRR